MLLVEIDAALGVGAALDALSVPWLIGGSVASSLVGVPRATVDVDLVAHLRAPHVRPLFEALAATYYVDEAVMRATAVTDAGQRPVHVRQRQAVRALSPAIELGGAACTSTSR